MGPAAVRVVYHESDLGCWQGISREPSGSLREYVRAYKGYVTSWARPGRRRAVVTGDVALIVNFGSPLGLSDPRDQAGTIQYRNAFVAGLSDSYSLYDWTGDSYGVQVDLTPIGAHLVLGLPMDELANRVVELDEALGRWGSLLTERLERGQDWEARFDLLESLITSRLAEARHPPPGVVHAWRRLRASGGQVSIGALANQLGYSHEHLTRHFRKYVGLPPKTLARILRFNRVMCRIERYDEAHWADIAFDCGYHDQSHLIRDFHRFAGSTPGEFLRLRLPEGGGVAG
jgi:AraC-like DNA-binding protein